MIGALHNLLLGFGTALTPANLLFAMAGVSVGQIIGVLPGLGPITGISLLIPLVFGMNPESGLIMLAGVYYGAMFGGAITSILINTPGDPAAVVTTFDGYPLGKRGEAGRALGIAAVSSFVGGTVAVVCLTLIAPLIARVALAFGPVEYTVLIFAALLTVAGISSSSWLKSGLAAVFGLALATVGQDAISGRPRFTFGNVHLLSGIPFIVVAIGLFAVGEVLYNVRDRTAFQGKEPVPVNGLLVSRADTRKIARPIAQGSVIGFITGLLPGAGATIATFLSYALAKRTSSEPETFGHGAVEGVAASESANNASVGGALVPMLTLGIPGSGSTAVLLGAMLVLGLEPGPLFFTNDPVIAWGVIASMYVGNIMLLILNIPLIRVFVQILRIPYSYIAVGVILLSVLGTYSLNNSLFDVGVMLIFGVVGLVMKANDFPRAPLVLTLVLGSLLESNWRRSLLISGGSYGIFAQSTVSQIIIGLTAASILVPLLLRIGRRKRYRPQQVTTPHEHVNPPS